MVWFQEIGYSSPCYTVGPFLFILNIRAASTNTKCLAHRSPCPPPLVATILFSMPVGCFCFVDRFTCVIVYIPHTSVVIYLSFSFWFTSLSMIISSCIYVASIGIISFFYSWVLLFCIYIYTTSSLFIHVWRFGLLPYLGYCEQCCYEH